VVGTIGIKVIAVPWFTDVSMWYLLKTDGILRPFIFQNREPIEFAAQAEGSSEEFHREKYYYGIRARYRLTYGRWQHAVRVNFTT
jgi:phage major head subunit gpT-like protein